MQKLLHNSSNTGLIHLVILFNIFKLYPRRSCNYAYEGTANVHLQFMDGLPATRYIMSIIVSSYQHCDEQQFQALSCVLYTIFFSNKARFSHTSTVTRLHFALRKKYAYASRGFCFYIEINIFDRF